MISLNELNQNPNVKVQTLINLLDELRSAIFNYTRIFEKIRFKEDKYSDFKSILNDAHEKIIDIFNKLDAFFNEGFFLELKKEDAEGISDEYQALVDQLIYTNLLLNIKSFQSFTDLINFYNSVIVPRSNDLNENIKVYNAVAVSNNWKYRLKTYEEAVKYVQNNMNALSKHKV